MRRLIPILLLLAAPVDAQLIHDRVYPAPTVALTQAALPPGTGLDHVVTADGLALTGIEAPGRADRPVLLVFHGNASAASDAATWLRPLIEQGCGLVAAEYRSYSGNPGRASEAGLAQDADAFFARAKLLAGGRKVIVIGHSLGAGVALGLARRQQPDAVVTIGAFSGLRAMAPRIVRAFMGDRYDNLGAVPSLTAPWYLLHGTADDVVPASEGNKLHNAAVTAHRQGDSFVLTGQGHPPDGALVATLVMAIDGQLSGRGWPAVLPAGVHFFTFGG